MLLYFLSVSYIQSKQKTSQSFSGQFIFEEFLLFIFKKHHCRLLTYTGNVKKCAKILKTSI